MRSNRTSSATLSPHRVASRNLMPCRVLRRTSFHAVPEQSARRELVANQRQLDLRLLTQRGTEPQPRGPGVSRLTGPLSPRPLAEARDVIANTDDLGIRMSRVGRGS